MVVAILKQTSNLNPDMKLWLAPISKRGFSSNKFLSGFQMLAIKDVTNSILDLFNQIVTKFQMLAIKDITKQSGIHLTRLWPDFKCWPKGT